MKNPFLEDGLYSTENISHHLPPHPISYSDILLKIRLDLAKSYATNASVLDVCCAVGQHLDYFSSSMHNGIGVDLSLPYLQKAITDAKDNLTNKKFFTCSNAKLMPFPTNHFDLVYSFSALYIIPNVEEVISEISRVLKPNGICILDLGNKFSINAISVREYHKQLGWAQQYNLSVKEMKQILGDTNLRIIEHRAFQILPMWGAERPAWLKIVLLPIWTQILQREFKGKMLDEWISNLPLIKFFSYRHIFICEKIA